MSAKLKIVIVGAGGRLGAALLREYSREYDTHGFNHAQLDLAAPETMREKLGTLEFDALINCAAQTNVDRCETERDEAFQLNAEAPRVLAEICTAKRVKLVHISTDYVFDGALPRHYSEDDPANPISVYGTSKLEGEKRVLATDANHVVARVSWIFGPDRPSFIDWLIGQARVHEQVTAVADKWSTPTYTVDLASLLRPLLTTRDAGGVLHVTNDGACSWREYAQWALDCCHAEGLPMKAREVSAITLADMKNFVARRPVHTVLSTARYQQLTRTSPRDWRDAVADYVRHHVAAQAQEV
jgi:dTDP-4-dehydrorhamnose reductase